MTTPQTDPLQAWLERMFGPDAAFHDGQREATEAVIRGERVLVVQRTGWGKSLVYWLGRACCATAAQDRHSW